MSFYEKWVEQDLNPILSFNSKGKIIYTNTEAQFLLNRIQAKELFDLAVTYASKSFGQETSYINLTIKNYTFYAITVIYENEEEIHLKLYKSASVKKEAKLNNTNINTINIFTLIDLAISSNKIKTEKIDYIKNYDPSIPEFKVDANSLVKVLNQSYEAFNSSKQIETKVKLKIGEYIKIEDKKYSLVCISISSKDNLKKDSNIEEDAFVLNFTNNKVEIDLPLII